MRSKRGYGLQRKRKVAAVIVSLLLKLETDGYPIRAIEGQVAMAQIALPGSHFPRAPLPLSAILPDAIFPRRIISYSIANYRMLSGRRFLTRFDLTGMPREELRTTFGNKQLILPFRTIIDFYFSLRRYLTFMNIFFFFEIRRE